MDQGIDSGRRGREQGGWGRGGALDVMRRWLQLSRVCVRGSGGSDSSVVHARRRAISKGEHSSPTFFFFYLTGKAFAFVSYLIINGLKKRRK